MSIITEAMRKAALQRGTASGPQAGAVTARPRARTRSSPAPRAEAADAVMRFQSTTLDPAAMVTNKVLTEITDRPARRSYKILRTRVLQRLEATARITDRCVRRSPARDA